MNRDNAPIQVPSRSLISCMWCSGAFPEVAGPTHKYMQSTPGCWAAFGRVLAREYGDQRYFAVHRLTVDAYAIQHPGIPSRQSIQSVSHALMLSARGWAPFVCRDVARKRIDRSLGELRHGSRKLPESSGIGSGGASVRMVQGQVDPSSRWLFAVCRDPWLLSSCLTTPSTPQTTSNRPR